MNQPYGFPPFDPSKMDPKVLMELSNLMRQLPPAQIAKMQTVMHNMMAGFDVKGDMEELEKSFPPGFKDKLTALMGSPGAMTGFTPPAAQSSDTIEIEPSSSASTSEMDLRNARMTILQAVADGRMSPDQAEKLLFPE